MTLDWIGKEAPYMMRDSIYLIKLLNFLNRPLFGYWPTDYSPWVEETPIRQQATLILSYCNNKTLHGFRQSWWDESFSERVSNSVVPLIANYTQTKLKLENHIHPVLFITFVDVIVTYTTYPYHEHLCFISATNSY